MPLYHQLPLVMAATGRPLKPSAIKNCNLALMSSACADATIPQLSACHLSHKFDEHYSGIKTVAIPRKRRSACDRPGAPIASGQSMGKLRTESQPVIISDFGNKASKVSAAFLCRK